MLKVTLKEKQSFLAHDRGAIVFEDENVKSVAQVPKFMSKEINTVQLWQ